MQNIGNICIWSSPKDTLNALKRYLIVELYVGHMRLDKFKFFNGYFCQIKCSNILNIFHLIDYKQIDLKFYYLINKNIRKFFILLFIANRKSLTPIRKILIPLKKF